MFRPGLPAQFVDEVAPVEAPKPDPAPTRPKFTPEMARAVAEARAAQHSKKGPKLIDNAAPAPSQTEPAVEPTVIPFAAALTATPVQPKPVAPTKVTSKPKPGTIPEHIRTGGGQSRTPAGQRK
jgi:hypothetical protein